MIDKDKYKAMDCPVCGEFRFSELDETDLEFYEDLQCPHCGWIYDYEQTMDPDLKTGVNELSLNEYKAWFEEQVKDDPEYDYQEANYKPQEHKCPVCGEHVFSDVGSFEICPQCGWVDDQLMEEEPDRWAGCANDLCLNDYVKRYKQCIKGKPNYKYSSDGYL